MEEKIKKELEIINKKIDSCLSVIERQVKWGCSPYTYDKVLDMLDNLEVERNRLIYFLGKKDDKTIF